MTIEALYQAISRQRPPVIYLSGKTATGKSTFGRKLRDSLEYQVIELEDILLDMIKAQRLDERATFRKVFHDSEESGEKSQFLNNTNHLLTEAVTNKRPLVIEGAVSNADTLQQILAPAGTMLFLYFHPRDIKKYVRNITQRFMQTGKDSYGGLPATLWQFIDDQEFETFCATQKLTKSLEDSIHQFALAAQKESLARLQKYRQKFKNIEVVYV